MARRLALGVVLAGLGALTLGGCSLVGLGKASKFATHNQSVFTLAVGQCLNPPQTIAAEVTTLSVTSCRAPHTEQVFAVLSDDAGSNYPGSNALVSFANAKCLQHFSSFVGIPYQQSSLFYTYLLPSVRSWSAGDRTVTCLITTTGNKLTTTMKGAKR